MHTRRRSLSGTTLLVLLLVCPALSLGQSQEDGDYIRWLEERSMLSQAARHARTVSGSGVQWLHRYARPQPRAAVRRASVWLLDYPGAVITKPGESIIGTWADPERW